VIGSVVVAASLALGLLLTRRPCTAAQPLKVGVPSVPGPATA
jgi:hypothetical protein